MPVSALQDAIQEAIEGAAPLLFVSTLEGPRVLASLRATGASVVLLEGPTNRKDLLAQIQNSPSGSILVSRDVSAWLEGDWPVDLLTNAVDVLEERRIAIWLVGSSRSIPKGLRRHMSLFEAPLPTLEERHALVTEFFPDADADAAFRWATMGQGLTGREWRRMLEHADRHSEAGSLEEFVAREKRTLLRNATHLELDSVPESAASLGGLEVLKDWLGSRKDAFGPRARQFGLPAPRGLLLLGVQGCGKSLAAKVTAAQWGLPLARLDIGQLFRSHGSADAALRDTLQAAESLAPLVLWIDEIDKNFSGLEKGGGEGLRRLFGTFITWLQEKNAPVFVIATANEVDGMPPELLRKGRFDEIFFVDLPDPAERRDILNIHLKKHGRNPDHFDLDALVQRSEFFSGAELAEAIVSGLYAAFAQKRELETGDVSLALQETVPLYFTYEERIKALREWARERARGASRDKRVLDLFRV